jgi:Arylsulfotransferase (ASST)
MPLPNFPRVDLCDRLLFVLAGLSFLWLSFTAGIVITYYQLPPSGVVFNDIKSGELWWLDWRSRGLAKDTSELPLNPLISKWDANRAFNGYTLITAIHSNHVFLIDMKGNVVYKWDTDFTKVWPRFHGYVNKAQVFPNGDLLAIYTGCEDTPYGYGIAKFDKDSHVLWEYHQYAHHDFYVDQANGNIYTLIHQFIKKPLPGIKELHAPMLEDFIAILSPNGKELDRISIPEAFRGTPYELMLLHRPAPEETPWDPTHTNSVTKLEPAIADKFPMFRAGDILVSMRHPNTLAVIDPLTRKVVWAYNGLWVNQHAARFMPNGDIVLFDNSGLSHTEGNSDQVSRVIEFDPKTLGVKWNYGGPEEPFDSWIWGSAQPLSNGNMLIMATTQGSAFEVTRDKRIVWKLDIPKGSSGNTIDILDSVTRYDEAALPFLREAKP